MASDRVDARDAGCVDDVRAAGHSSVSRVEVEHVPLDELEVRVRSEVRPREGVAMEIVDGDHVVPVDEPSRERRADESGAARDENALARSVTRGDPSGVPFVDMRPLLVLACALALLVPAAQAAPGTSLTITYSRTSTVPPIASGGP